jgi:hypothetical protein
MSTTAAGCRSSRTCVPLLESHLQVVVRLLLLLLL